MTASDAAVAADGAIQRLLAAFDQRLLFDTIKIARQALLDALAHASEQDWLECGRALVLRGDKATAFEIFSASVRHHPDSGELCIGLAGLHWEMHRPVQAEALLREQLLRHSADVAATFLLARVLQEQARMQAVAEAMRQLFEHGVHDVDTLIQAIELLDDCRRPQDALSICLAEIARGCTDARVHAYAGVLQIQLGHFENAREHYEFALAHDLRAVEWNIPIGLSSLQRYVDASHPDFAMFRGLLQRDDLSAATRTMTLFALGKACDDIAEYELATTYLREANNRANAAGNWSRKCWKRVIDARLAAPSPLRALSAPPDWTPVFIVGVPRSGTTLMAELISRHPDVCNRGEIGLHALAERLSRSSQQALVESLDQAALAHAAKLRQDDSPAHWFIDKQPLNLLHVDLILTLWPNARIIHCQRDARDTALSLWSQSFHDPAHDYAYDMGNIAAVIQGCRKLASHWQRRYPASVFTVHYEQLVSAPEKILATLSTWLELPEADVGVQGDTHAQGIRTASAWQARQPVNTRSAGRWRHYVKWLPELLKIPEH